MVENCEPLRNFDLESNVMIAREQGQLGGKGDLAPGVREVTR